MLTALAALCVAPAFAGDKEKALGSFGAWRAYSYREGGQTVCYMVDTKLVKSTGPKKRATSYVMITHRPTEVSTDVFSYGAGTLLNSRRGVHMLIGKSTFDLFSVRDTSWSRDSLTDHKIAAALKTSPVAQLSALPDKKGAHPFSDSFDLTGGAQAYHAIGVACGLPGMQPKKPVTHKTAPHSAKSAKKPASAKAKTQ